MCELKAEQERSERGGKSVSTNPRKRDARKYVHPHTELISTARLCLPLLTHTKTK